MARWHGDRCTARNGACACVPPVQMDRITTRTLLCTASPRATPAALRRMTALTPASTPLSLHSTPQKPQRQRQPASRPGASSIDGVSKTPSSAAWAGTGLGVSVTESPVKKGKRFGSESGFRSG